MIFDKRWEKEEEETKVWRAGKDEEKSDLITRTKEGNRRGGEARRRREEDGKYDKGIGKKKKRTNSEHLPLNNRRG